MEAFHALILRSIRDFSCFFVPFSIKKGTFFIEILSFFIEIFGFSIETVTFSIETLSVFSVSVLLFSVSAAIGITRSILLIFGTRTDWIRKLVLLEPVDQAISI